MWLFLHGPCLLQAQVTRAASELDRRTQQLKPRILALEKILSEKELEMFRLHKAVSALEAEKESWNSAMENLKQEHRHQVEKLRLEAILEKVALSNTYWEDQQLVLTGLQYQEGR